MDLDGVETLMDLGMTETEAMVYLCLAQQSPATGYKVAQLIGKPVANTYKAISSLEQKGLLFIDKGAKRLCRIMPYEEMLSLLERRFTTRKKHAQKVLSKITSLGRDDLIYHLTSVDQVLERCRAILNGAKQVVVIDVFPMLLKQLRNEIAAVVSSEVEVIVKAYEAVEIPGAQVTLDYRGQQVLEKWSGQWLNIVADGIEYLLAFLSNDGKHVNQAVWSTSPYLSWMYHAGLMSEIVLDRVESLLAQGGTTQDIRHAISNHRQDHLIGFKLLTSEFSSDSSFDEG